jgi:hypothetical protein
LGSVENGVVPHCWVLPRPLSQTIAVSKRSRIAGTSSTPAACSANGSASYPS